MSLKNEKQLERHLKEVANHHRIAILRFIEKNEEITIDGIIQKLNANFKNMSEHTRKGCNDRTATATAVWLCRLTFRAYFC